MELPKQTARDSVDTPAALSLLARAGKVVDRVFFGRGKGQIRDYSDPQACYPNPYLLASMGFLWLLEEVW